MRRTRLIFMLAALAMIAFGTYRRTHTSQNVANSKPGDDNLVLEVRTVPVRHGLALGSFVVPAKTAREVKITVDEAQMRHPRLVGHFTTSNGPGIEVMLLDDTQYSLFRGRQAPSGILYMSKTTTSGDIDAAIPRGGTYYLVFDNSNSDTNANVQADVTLSYDTVRVDSPSDPKK